MRWVSTVSLRLPLACLVNLAACSPPPAATPASTAPHAASTAPPGAAATVAGLITREQVSGATIAGVFDRPFTFVEGKHESQPIEPDGASREMAVLMPEVVALGELDDQPGADAAALIASNRGGSGEFVSLAIVGMRNGKATSVATAAVGDRTRIRALRVSGRDIVIDVVEIGQGEPACCGTQLATKTYRLEGSTLTQVSSTVTGTLSLASTAGGRPWKVVAFDGVAVDAAAPPATLSLVDGRLTGTSGCNQYSARITEPKPGILAIGPATGTRRACAGAAANIERQFLRNLGKTTNYTFLGGRLVLSGLDGEQRRSITFTR